LPAVSIMIGVAVESSGLALSSTKLGRYGELIPLLFLVAAVASGFFIERVDFFSSSPLGVSRSTYGTNPFPEALKIASYLKDHSTSEDRIAILGSEPEIYFYADRLSATGYIYMYGLMESQPYAGQMQVQLIREIEAARPKYIVVVNVKTSWLARSTSIQSVFNWYESYLKNLYQVAGVIDIIDDNTTRYLWDDQAAIYNPVSEDFVTVYKRKSGI
jgi:hypothetical protein